jgi:hypothetical protein
MDDRQGNTFWLLTEDRQAGRRRPTCRSEKIGMKVGGRARRMHSRPAENVLIRESRGSSLRSQIEEIRSGRAVAAGATRRQRQREASRADHAGTRRRATTGAKVRSPAPTRTSTPTRNIRCQHRRCGSRRSSPDTRTHTLTHTPSARTARVAPLDIG